MRYERLRGLENIRVAGEITLIVKSARRLKGEGDYSVLAEGGLRFIIRSTEQGDVKRLRRLKPGETVVLDLQGRVGLPNIPKLPEEDAMPDVNGV